MQSGAYVDMRALVLTCAQSHICIKNFAARVYEGSLVCYNVNIKIFFDKVKNEIQIQSIFQTRR